MGIQDLLMIALGVILVIGGAYLVIYSPRRSLPSMAGICLMAGGIICIRKGAED